MYPKFLSHAALPSDTLGSVATDQRYVPVEQQKRHIFYNNAAHFLRLSKEVSARHHLF
jgi:hypothetical protein